jgi:hypothetical protein
MRTTAHAALHHDGGTSTAKSVSPQWEFARRRRYASEKPMRMCTSRMCNDNDRTDEAKGGPLRVHVTVPQCGTVGSMGQVIH